MSLVIDASVALKWVLDEPGGAEAEALLDEALIAPGLWLIEAANALWKRAGRGEISADEAAERLQALLHAPVATPRTEDDLASALSLASQLAHPVYDCLYLALAIRENTQVVTADTRFYAVAERHAVSRGRVRLLTR
jgi:predicted nucleic acid-binding protein